MKIFKKIVLFTLVVAMICAFAACGSDNSNDGGENTLGTVKSGVLTMATNPNFPPYEFYDGDKIVGIDAEIAGLIAEKLGLELNIVDIEFGSIIPGVQTKKFDMGMAGMTVTEERKKNVNFSDSYATGVQVVIVPENSDIKTIDDLEGKTIGVQQSTTGEIYASSQYGDDHVVSYTYGPLAVEGLKGGKVDCIITDSEPAKAYVANNTGLKILDTEYAVEDYAICFNLENTALRDAVNAALKELIADGSVQKIIDKYINTSAE